MRSEKLLRDLMMFRLTAIRETFEESGVLLYRDGESSGAFSDSAYTAWLSEMRGKVRLCPDQPRPEEMCSGSERSRGSPAGLSTPWTGA